MFMGGYVTLDLYDEDIKKIFITYHEELQFHKNDGWNVIGIPEEPDG